VLVVWVGQPILHGTILKRQQIKSRQILDDVAFEAMLTAEQVHEIRNQQANPPQARHPVRVQIDAYFETRLGWIEVVDFAERALPA